MLRGENPVRNRYVPFIAWFLGTLCAEIDEIHQLFSDERTAQLRDVCIDSAGVLLGILLTCALLKLFGRIKSRKKKGESDEAQPV